MNREIRDHYDVLGLDPSSKPSDDEIKRAYRKVAMQTHPDRNPGDTLAEELFKRANRAYQALTKKETEFDLPRRSPSGPWDGTSGIVRQKTLEELAMDLKSRIEQRMQVISRVRLDLDDEAIRLDDILRDIVSAATDTPVSEKLKQQFHALRRVRDVTPKMKRLISDKLKDLKSGKLYDLTGDNEEADINLKATTTNFFYASKDLKKFIAEIDLVIPGNAGGLKRMIHDARRELEHAQRARPKLLGSGQIKKAPKKPYGTDESQGAPNYG